MAEFFRKDKSELLQRMILRSSLAFLLLVLSGCALIFPEPPPPVVTTIPEAEPRPAPAVEVAPDVDPPAPVVATVPEPVSERVAIVLSESRPAYTNVSSNLLPYLEDYRIYDMADPSRSPRQSFAALEEWDAELVVALGLSATRTAKTFARVPVIFSQVFNVSENDLISDDIKGVALLPPLELQIEAWRAMDPNIRNVGAILGEGHEDLVAEAEQAMKRRGINFNYAIANSDRETLYLFKRLVRDIDGYLLFPDNRILSRTVFKEIMSDAARHRVQVAVFNDSLLPHGATFSASSVDTNVANTIAFALNEIVKGNIGDLAPLSPLSEIRIQTNPAMARKFGLDVSGLEIDNSVADAQ
jgi:ABC-type uncharacterized transport system substrate-binding protein